MGRCLFTEGGECSEWWKRGFYPTPAPTLSSIPGKAHCELGHVCVTAHVLRKEDDLSYQVLTFHLV